MGIREWMDAHTLTSKGVIGFVVLVAIGVVAFEIFGGQRGITKTLPDVFFTDDDGKTFFAASPENVPPFDHNGKTAVAAYVYRCDGQEFVAFMGRYTPEARARIIAAKKVTPEDERFGRELKKPGDKDWVKGSDLRRINQIADVKGPKGQTAVEPVEPEM